MSQQYTFYNETEAIETDRRVENETLVVAITLRPSRPTESIVLDLSQLELGFEEGDLPKDV